MTVASFTARVVAAATPRRILLVGWALLVLYAHPGYMSYDSVQQLLQARVGAYTGGHPPMMGVVWGALDALIPGPLGMLLVQVTCFLAGVSLLLRRAMTGRAAALATVAIGWLPPVSAVLAVIWKDAQMMAFLALGATLLVGERRGARLAGLALLFLATAMRYNALAITLPLVALLFVWDARHRWFVRYPLALAAWGAITLAASVTNAQLSNDTGRIHVWHESLALLDLTGTLRHAPALDEAQLRAELAGVPLTPLAATASPQAIARASHRADDLDAFTVSTFGSGVYVPALWVTARHLFELPTTPAQRAAVARAWRSIVLGHPAAYLAYRWEVTRERLHLGDAEIPSATYVWFTDVTNLATATASTGHNAVPSRLQRPLQAAMLWTGTSWLFRPWLYLALALALVPLARRQRAALALLLSGLANEALLFAVAPTIDYRYSAWLVAATLVALATMVPRRRRAGPAQG